MLSPRDLLASLATFSSATRLYAMAFKDERLDVGELLVEAFLAVDELQTVGARDVIVLSTNGSVDLDVLLGQQASFQISLADGTRASFTGLVNEADMLGSSADLVRYRIRLVSLMWPLSQVRNSRSWNEKSVVDIVEAVLADYPAIADWRWSEDAVAFMGDARPRSYCCQFRETDLDFITRLLTSEGIAWRVEESAGSPAGHRIVFFADSTQTSACPEDATSASALGGHGIRYHGARAGEAQDSIQGLSARERLGAAAVSTLSYDYKSKQIVAATVPTNLAVGGKHAPMLEHYDAPGAYAYASAAEATRYATLQMEAMEVRRQLWRGRATVRTLAAGVRLTLTQGPLKEQRDSPPDYVVTRVLSAGVNNMPKPAIESLGELFGALPELLEESMEALGLMPAPATRQALADTGADPTPPPRIWPGYAPRDLIAQILATGYANHFDMVPAALPWRPVLADGSGTRLHPRPTALGSQTAIVVGADGQSQPNGADEVYVDALGRVRIRFHWQTDASTSCWVRVGQRSAGGGMGAQFLPRIGQEVLVQFMENNIDRPVIVGALYNGQGEGGVLPTPAGNSEHNADHAVFAQAHDHRVAGQGNLAGGNSPLWHGASADSAGHRNNGALTGMRSKEFGGNGYNQLLFDDTDNQGAIQLKSTHGATELNLGHLIHRADNHRGSFRGVGAELRTDAWGAVRAGQGWLISSYAGIHTATSRDPAGDNAPGLAHLKQAMQLAGTFSNAALVHKTVGFASHLGGAKADSSTIDDQAAPLKALYTAAAGMVAQESIDSANTDAADKKTAPDKDKLPHSTDPIIAIAAKGGLGIVAAQDIQFANGETVTLMSGQDSQFYTGGQMRVQTGQAIGVLAGAVKAGENNVGLQLIAAQQPIDIQAQSDTINIAARDEVNVMSANAHIDWAGAKGIVLQTAGGASINITGGNISVECPGKLTIKAGKKSFLAPERLDYPMPKLPNSVCLECILKAMKAGSAVALKS
jgi:type VI secretion system secreted protein VgrG